MNQEGDVHINVSLQNLGIAFASLFFLGLAEAPPASHASVWPSCYYDYACIFA